MRTKTIRAALAAICVATMPSLTWAATNIAENVALTEDTDWRGLGVVTVASGATLDLNGHTLRVAALGGAGNIVNSASYQLLEYVEAAGAQRIDTDIIPGANTAVDVVATATTAPNNLNKTLFGAKWAVAYLCFAQDTTWYCLYNKSFTDSALKGNKRRIVVGSGKATIFDGETGTQIGTTTPSLANSSGNVLSICGLPDDTQYGYWRVHSFKIWHENVLRYDLVPVRKSATDEVGLLNQVDGRFYASETDTEFIAGPALEEFIAGPALGGLQVEAASEAALANFSGTVDSSVSMSLQGDCVLSSDADWRRFPTLLIDGTVDLAGHDLSLSDLLGTGGITDSSKVYERLEYVEANGKQIVNTGIVPSTDTAVEADITYLYNEGNVLFGCDQWNQYRYMLVNSGNQYFHFFGKDSNFGAPTVGIRYLITVNPGTSQNGTVTVVNTATGATTSKTDSLANNGNSELRLFGLGDGTRKGTFRLHSFKITKGGELKRDFVPVHDLNSGKVGLLDNVSGDVFTSNTGTDLIGGPVVASEGRAGRLYIDVPESHTVKTESLALSGSLVLVKDGKGTLVANRTGQTYAGGTRIEDGCVEATCDGHLAPLGIRGNSENPGSDIIVGSGAVFDFKGYYNYRWYNVVLDGGTLRNGGGDQAQGSAGLGHLTLTADSTLDFAYNTTVLHVVPIYFDLGGHELTVSALTVGKQLYFRNAGTITNGVFLLKNGTDWRINAAVNARGTTLRAEGTLYLGATLDVDNYYAACSTNVNNGTAAMNVYGRFTPATDYFYGCTLQDGSTLDLNDRTGAWSTTSAFTKGSNRVTFASGAAITIDVHDRATWGGKIVDWGEGNMPTDVTFRLDELSKASGRALRVRSDGLYAVSGLMIIFR